MVERKLMKTCEVATSFIFISMRVVFYQFAEMGGCSKDSVSLRETEMKYLNYKRETKIKEN